MCRGGRPPSPRSPPRCPAPAPPPLTPPPPAHSRCRPPPPLQDYIHRIGRTGRAGKTGLSHTFFTTEDKARAGELVNVLREAGAPVPEDLVKRFDCSVKKREHSLYGAHFKGSETGQPMKASSKMTFGDD